MSSSLRKEMPGLFVSLSVSLRTPVRSDVVIRELQGEGLINRDEKVMV
jgi:hypothetical protein